MQDIKLINTAGIVRIFRFVTPAALSTLRSAGWMPTR